MKNEVTEQLDKLISNWRAWADDMGYTQGLESLDEQSCEGKAIIKELNVLEDLLRERGYNSMYFKGLKND